MNKIIQKIRKELRENADKKTKEGFQRFFKEKVKFYGVKSEKINRIAKNNFQKIKNLTKAEFILLCDELFGSGFCEESLLAANLVYWYIKNFESEDIKVFEKWINKYIENWAECDTLCNHAVGTFIEMYPKHLKKLLDWSKSKNRWVKRATAVSLILPVRNGKFLKEAFNIADNLLTDADDMVQKGYGWLLKEASKKHQNEVFNYVMKYKKIMPRTALRYAIEKMPRELRQKAMAK